MIHRILKGLAPLAALAGAALVTGCDNMNIHIGDGDGVPLAELDMSGAAPTELVLAGPDKVIVTEGEKLDIAVSGEDAAVDAVRFSLDEGSLGISRAKDMGKIGGVATVRVTMPSLTAMVLAGSGDIEAASMRGKADVTIAGSGKAKVARFDADSLDLTIAGSGSFEGAGTVDMLDMTVAGSGKADMAGLKVGNADISVAGSGDAEFASDGKVDASIMGSGTIMVNGRADCTVSAMGSGALNCRDIRTATQAPTAPDAPSSPTAPDAPATPET
ncbi:head GIN domain-containing protein [Qipengyuania pacifica]|uniref:head GIN domain-containing protein n=1 Tax=Qipengyuania pacifica TaxID=2860199 RepID=UPI0035C840AC